MSRSSWRHVWLPLAELTALLLLVPAHAAVRPADGTIGFCGTLRERPGDLETWLLFVFGEVLVLYAVLRPRSYRRSWARSLEALLIFAPWTLIMVATSIHGAPVSTAHTLWLLLVCAGLLVTTIVSSVAALHHRFAKGEADA